LLIVIQAFINMAVAVNLIPVTGQPLPLISRGGTSTMLTCFYFGIILSVSRFGAGMGEEFDNLEGEDDATETISLENEATDAVSVENEISEPFTMELKRLRKIKDAQTNESEKL
jgi:cell division protein FtsW